MTPDVGTVAAFTFISQFENLNGNYRVRAEITFQDALASGVDFVAFLYVPAGLSDLEYSTDFRKYTNDKVLVLESIVDKSVIYYVPESIFLNIPDPTIKEYFDLNLIVNLGMFKNTQEIFPLLDQIKDIVKSSVGIENPVYVVTNPDNKSYLTDSQYEAVKQDRESRATGMVSFYNQLKQSEKDNAILRAKLAAYEDRIIEQATS